jgi:hypothetical protein
MTAAGQKCEELALSICCPLYPVSDRRADIRNRQLRAKTGREQLQKGSPLFDHLVGAEDHVRNFKTNRLCSFHIEHKLETRCLIHRQVDVNVRKAVVVFDAEQAVIISKIDPAKMYNMTFIHPFIVSRVSHAARDGILPKSGTELQLCRCY